MVKKLIVFDLDGTLAESKSALDPEMSGLLHDLLGIVKVAVISGGGWPQFEKQLISKLPQDERLRELPCFLAAEHSFISTRESGKNSMKKTSPGMNVRRYSVLSNKRCQKLVTKSQRSGEKSSKTGEFR